MQLALRAAWQSFADGDDQAMLVTTRVTRRRIAVRTIAKPAIIIA
ncbi:hypothetical protein [Polymorphobacter arshaanensis]|nr:hypothetical protein [Polymorphobacter arshaanensis]